MIDRLPFLSLIMCASVGLPLAAPSISRSREPAVVCSSRYRPSINRPLTSDFYFTRIPPLLQSEELSFGTAYVFYPEATDERCTVALLVEIDPIGLVRGRRGPAGEAGQLQQYVNDRPYTANSFLSVAIGGFF